MKRFLFASAFIMASLATAQAGWFGETYPFKAAGAARDGFIGGVTASCIQKTPANNPFRLSVVQTQRVCFCRAEALADTVTEAELKLVAKNDAGGLAAFTARVNAADLACVKTEF